MKQKLFLQDLDNGYSLLELLVSMAIGMSVLSIGFATMSNIRHSYRQDVVRTRMNQDLRATMDFVGATIRQAGEGMTNVFPAIELVNGAFGAPDRLTLRKTIISEKPSVCANITAGQARTNIAITNSAPTSGCAYGSNASNYNAWQSYRLANGGGVLAYIYNYATDQGEYFGYSTDSNVAGAYTVGTFDGGIWSYSYTVGTSQLYILEDWTFRLNGDELVMIERGDNSNPWAVAFAITNFQVRIELVDGTSMTTFTPSDDWTTVNFVEVTLDAEQIFRGEIITSSLTTRYFPRNVLSN